ncbi:MAG: malonate transporter subunit MadL [Ruminococcaceae bacterium]|nr:malonate transporter subunit MadL [Oscillospiraceae bacterium]
MIYGVALLAGCMFVGSFVGNLIGLWTGLNSDVGGVGFAMILLLIATNSKKVNSILPQNYTKGIEFWKEMFIPVIIAMSASQNVVSALDGGALALSLGVGIVVIMLLLIPVFNMFSPKETKQEDKEVQK